MKSRDMGDADSQSEASEFETMTDRSRKGSRGVSRRAALRLGGSALAVAATGLTSCAGTGAVFNPATVTWLSDLAGAVAATQIDKALGGLSGIWKPWSSKAASTVASSTQGREFYYEAWAHPAPPVILFSIMDKDRADPMRDTLLACVDTGKEAVRFEPWAWQALSMYVHEITDKKTGDDLAAYQSLCLLTLIPSGTKPNRKVSPEGTVAWMTYQARNGTVEIAKVEEPDGSMSAHVTASGILDASQSARKMKYKLPTQAATA